MADSVDALIADLLEWIGPGRRPYREVVDAWRTSCPRMPVWEEAQERGFLEQHGVGAASTVSVSEPGARFLAGLRGANRVPPGGRADAPAGAAVGRADAAHAPVRSRQTGSTARMAFDIYGRFQLEVGREGGAWVAYRTGTGTRAKDASVCIPAALHRDEIAGYLDDLFHELSARGQAIRLLA